MTALVTIAVPSYNQAAYLNQCLSSIFSQELPVEVFVMDGGSTDGTLDIINKWETKLAWWRSHPDAGQAAAINEGIASGTAPYVCWLNSDDWFQSHGLTHLVSALQHNPDTPATYGLCSNYVEKSGRQYPVWVEPFDRRRLAIRCIISQPASLIRRTAWEKVGGLRPELHLALDYDLWWRLYLAYGPLYFVKEQIAVNRIHNKTKTNTLRKQHYQEAIAVVRRYYGSVPVKWWLAQPYAVWFKSIIVHH